MSNNFKTITVWLHFCNYYKNLTSRKPTAIYFEQHVFFVFCAKKIARPSGSSNIYVVYSLLYSVFTVRFVQIVFKYHDFQRFAFVKRYRAR